MKSKKSIKPVLNGEFPIVDLTNPRLGLLTIFIDEIVVGRKKKGRKNGFYMKTHHLAVLGLCMDATDRKRVSKLPIPELQLKTAIKELLDCEMIVRKGGYLKTQSKGEEAIQEFYKQVVRLSQRWDRDFDYLKDRKST